MFVGNPFKKYGPMQDKTASKMLQAAMFLKDIEKKANLELLVVLLNEHKRLAERLSLRLPSF